MLTWIPFIGPIIEGIVSIVKGQQDTTVKKYQEDTKRQGKETDADVAIVQSRVQMAIAFKDDIGAKLSRDCLVFMGSVYSGLFFWDHIFARYPSFTVGVSELPSAMQYLPYAIIAYLFGLAYRGRI